MKRTWDARVKVKILDEPVNDSPFHGMNKSELSKVEILSWGTNRDGTPFACLQNELQDGMIGYIRKDAMGISLSEKIKIMDRGYIIGLD